MTWTEWFFSPVSTKRAWSSQYRLRALCSSTSMRFLAISSARAPCSRLAGIFAVRGFTSPLQLWNCLLCRSGSYEKHITTASEPSRFSLLARASINRHFCLGQNGAMIFSSTRSLQPRPSLLFCLAARGHVIYLYRIRRNPPASASMVFFRGFTAHYFATSHRLMKWSVCCFVALYLKNSMRSRLMQHMASLSTLVSILPVCVF